MSLPTIFHKKQTREACSGPSFQFQGCLAIAISAWLLQYCRVWGIIGSMQLVTGEFRCSLIPRAHVPLQTLLTPWSCRLSPTHTGPNSGRLLYRLQRLRRRFFAFHQQFVERVDVRLRTRDDDVDVGADARELARLDDARLRVLELGPRRGAVPRRVRLAPSPKRTAPQKP